MQQPPKGRLEDASVSRMTSDQTHEEILEYWTKQRMADAKPREQQLPEGSPRLMKRGADPAPRDS